MAATADTQAVNELEKSWPDIANAQKRAGDLHMKALSLTYPEESQKR